MIFMARIFSNMRIIEAIVKSYEMTNRFKNFRHIKIFKNLNSNNFSGNKKYTFYYRNDSKRGSNAELPTYNLWYFQKLCKNLFLNI